MLMFLFTVSSLTEATTVFISGVCAGKKIISTIRQ